MVHYLYLIFNGSNFYKCKKRKYFYFFESDEIIEQKSINKILILK